MQISSSRLPQTPPRPDATSARATVAAVTAALTTATAGDTVELSTAALAASDRLTAGQTPGVETRPLPGTPITALPMPPGRDASWQPVPTPQPTASAPRWENLPYAPQSLVVQAPPLPGSWPALSHFTKVTLITVTFALAILFGALVS